MRARAGRGGAGRCGGCWRTRWGGARQIRQGSSRLARDYAAEAAAVAAKLADLAVVHRRGVAATGGLPAPRLVYPLEALDDSVRILLQLPQVLVTAGQVGWQV